MTENLPNETIWEIHETHPDWVQPLRENLSKVVDPEIGMNLIQLGLIREVRVEEGRLKIHMILTTPFCPYAPALLEAARQKAQEAVDIPVEMEMGFEPWDYTMMEDPDALNWGMF
jgi:metal-sulfur cluster biosynthetic enzyme